MIDVRFLHRDRNSLLPGGAIRRKRRHSAYRVSESGEDLPDPEKPGDDNEFVARDDEVDVLRLWVRRPNFDLIHSPLPGGRYKDCLVLFEGQTAETANYDTT